MKCFYSDADAVGTCKSCGRGLSLEHATEFPKGLACKNRCEEDVKALIALIERNIRISAASPALMKGNANATAIAGCFYLFMGLVFVYFGITSRGFTLGLVMGAGFLIFGFYALMRASRLNKANKEAKI